MTVAENENSFIDFEVDASLIGSLIHSQNGTISTAIRELVMNSFDHNSTKCEIRLGASGFEVLDNGLGFQGKESVDKFFRRFGEPHKEGDATFGRWRIGRGQCMSLGMITWNSNEFTMKTDVKNNGYGFTFLEDKNSFFKGCAVSGTFYEKVDSWNLREATEDIEKLVKYLDKEVTLNGVLISSFDGEIRWSFEDEDVKIIWNPSRHKDGIYLYSLGVFVKEIGSHFFGINADIVTKKALTLNMARNEINHNDPLWIKISKILQEKSLESGKEKCKKSKNIDEPTRRSLIKQFLSGNLQFNEMCEMPLLRDCRGHSLKVNLFWNSSLPVVVSSEAGSRIASHIASTKIALVLHHDELRIWNVEDLNGLIWLFYDSAIFEDRKKTANLIASVKCSSFADISKGINDEYNLIPDKELSSRERAAKSAIQYANKIMTGRIQTILGSDQCKLRKIHIGESLVADGWTDSKNYIAINKLLLHLLDRGPAGAAQITQLMLHEYCHDECDVGSHEHDFSFYEKFHDLSSDYKTEVIGHTTESLYNQYLNELMKRNEKIPETTVRKFDFPIINDIKTYSGNMNGKGLSALARILLDATHATFKESKNKFEATINDTNLNLVMKRVSSCMITSIEKSGFKFLDSNLVGASTSDWQQADNILKEDRLLKAREWAIKYQHDVDFVDEVMKERVTFDKLLQLICRDRNSGLICFEHKVLYPNRCLGSGNYSFNFKTSSSSGYFGRRISNESLAKNKKHRVNYVVDAIKDIVKGIEDKNEREEFINTYLGENLAIQLL